MNHVAGGRVTDESYLGFYLEDSSEEDFLPEDSDLDLFEDKDRMRAVSGVL